ncbi:hypothetical protein LINGRAHAP2_LOCUS13326 [Linum grandiflorum]
MTRRASKGTWKRFCRSTMN